MEAPFMASTTPQSTTTFCSYPDETVNNDGASLWGEETFFPHEFQQMNICDTVVVPFSNYPERLGISSDMAVPTLPDSTTTLCSFHDGIIMDPNFGGNNMQYCNTEEACDFGSDCCYDSDYYNRPLDLGVHDTNWRNESEKVEQEMQAKQAVPVIEDSTMRVGRYTVEERKDRILRYLKKRNQRNFNKTIKYACRKTLADRRVRVRGRFARNSGSCEDDMAGMQKNAHDHEAADPQQRNDLFFGHDPQQMKQDGADEWLQAAIASLIYLPYVSG